MRILVGVDGSEPSRVACDLFASRSWPRETLVRLVAVMEPPAPWIGMPMTTEELGARRDEVAAVLDERADTLRRTGLACEIAVEIGHPAEILLAIATGWFADLVVVGSRGRGAAASALFGSVSAHLVDHAPCPVLVTRAPRADRMLLATDGTRSSLEVPRILARWRPAFHGVEVEVLSIADGRHAADGLADRRRIADSVADEMVELGWSAAAVARTGDPGREIVRAAEGYGADLVVTGSRCLGTLGRLLLGSVAHAVLLGTHDSVLVVRGHLVAPVRERSPVATAPA